MFYSGHAILLLNAARQKNSSEKKLTLEEKKLENLKNEFELYKKNEAERFKLLCNTLTHIPAVLTNIIFEYGKRDFEKEIKQQEEIVNAAKQNDQKMINYIRRMR
jgi:hypothetical protein